MNGYVVGQQPRLNVVFRLPDQREIAIEFVVDTGFEGTLTLPMEAVTALGLTFYQRIVANLADDSARHVPVFRATIIWQGQEGNIAVLAMGQRPLLGTALLNGNDLFIHFEEQGSVAVTSF